MQTSPRRLALLLSAYGGGRLPAIPDGATTCDATISASSKVGMIDSGLAPGSMLYVAQAFQQSLFNYANSAHAVRGLLDQGVHMSYGRD